jgi:uncharacterized protein
MNQILKYKCPKCGSNQYETGEMRTVGSLRTRIFGIFNRRFTFVSCQNCHYTELFKVALKEIGEVYNFMAH